MANITYRETSSPSVPGSTTVKGTPLTNNEVDGNFYTINAEVALKAPLASPTFSGTVVLPGTTSIGTVSATEIGYLDGVTSSVQTQITNAANAAAAAAPAAGSASITTLGTIATGVWQGTGVDVAYGGTGASTLAANAVLLGNGTSPIQTVAPGVDGNVLQSNGTTWVSVAPGASGATLADDNTTDVTQYIGMSRITSGAWTEAYVASTQLYFNPSTGTLNSTTFNSLSDRNLKENIVPIMSATDKVKQLNGVEFTWKSGGKKSAGVIAQELEEVLPWLVETSDGVKSVNYAGLTGYLIQTIKELSTRIEVLENK